MNLESGTESKKISTKSRNGTKGSFNHRLFSFDSSGCGLSSVIENLTLETPLDFFELFFNSKLLEMSIFCRNKPQLYSYRDVDALFEKKTVFMIIGLRIILSQHPYLLNFSSEIDSELY